MTLFDLASAILYRIEPERAHSLGMFFMRFLRQQKFGDSALTVKTQFGEIKNPIGLAAGFDKTGKHLSTLQKLGFGYLVTGTITLESWKGHPKPRIVRNVSDRTLMNCLGFPNPGADSFIENIRKQKIVVPLIASISGTTQDSILECYEKIQPHVAGIEVNLSSPNTKNLKDLREIDSFKLLAKRLLSSRKRPTYLKVPPFYEMAQSIKNLEMIKVWSDLGFEGVTSGNAIPVKEPRLSMGAGGYSGPPLFNHTIDAIKQIRKIVPANFEINSVGGITNPSDVRQALSQGAKTVQLLTSLVYDGPELIGRLLEGISETEGSSAEVQKVKVNI